MRNVDLKSIVQRFWDHDALAWVAKRKREGVYCARQTRGDEQVFGCDRCSRRELLFEIPGQGITKAEGASGPGAIREVLRGKDGQLRRQKGW